MLKIISIFVCISFFSLIIRSEDIETDIPVGVLKEERYRCTSIGVGPAATVDGSTITTHNNDCQECDIRITHVPARDWPAGSKRPIFGERVAYPRYLERPEDNVHGPDYLYGTQDSSIYSKWTPSVPLIYIDQVEHTYGYTFGSYAIQNEKQVSMGESTCGSIFVSTPSNAKGGKANFNMHALNEIALERCDTAICAIKTMGELGVKYGFYGPGWDSPDIADGQGESGEAIVVSDPSSTWMFHIAADDTGGSAIWVAQRVPDGHITAVANMFVIGEIDLSDPANFLASENIFEVAIRHKLWDPKSGIPFNFKNIYGTNRYDESALCTRRVWRVFTLAAPSLVGSFSPYTNNIASFGFGPDGSQPYPFSVKPDRLLTVKDIMTMTRDYYEGTEFDQSSGVDAGPFGDPMRYMPTPKWEDKVNGVVWDAYKTGYGYQRVISLWRTAYATVTQSRAGLPNEIGAVTWIAQYAPHQSVFVPVYGALSKVPNSLRVGTQYKIEKSSNYWAHSVVANYLSRWYKYTIGDIRSMQNKLETDLFSRQPVVEGQAVELIRTNHDAAIQFLEKYQEDTATYVRDSWWDFFWVMVGKYRDMYQVTSIHYENFLFAARYLTVPRWWLEMIGFWGPPGTPCPGEASAVPIKPIGALTLPSKAEYDAVYPNGAYQPYPSAPVVSPPHLPKAPQLTSSQFAESGQWDATQLRQASATMFSNLGLVTFGILFGVCFTLIIQSANASRSRYLPITSVN